MLRARALLVFALLALVGSTAHAVLVPGDSVRTLVSGGIQRHYLLHVPAQYTGTTAVPLVIDIHGLGSNASQQRGISGMVAVADREGFVIAHPEGVTNRWNAGICCGNVDLDDVGFIRELVAAISADGNIDASRVYATGLSNGGAMTQRLACDAADLFAAAAPLAFPVPFEPLSGCQPSRTMPVLTFMGLTDVLVRYDGPAFPSAHATRDFWRQIDGCKGDTPDESTTTGKSGCEYWKNCTADVQTGLCSITARSFGGTAVDGHILYFNDDLVLADVVWSFLSQFRLPAVTPVVTASLAGSDRLRLRGLPASVASLGWHVRLGAGTWSAEADDGTPLAGSARKRGRRWILSLTDDARATLLTALATRASAAAGHAVTLSAPKPERLRAVVDTRGGVHLVGRIVVEGEDGSSGVLKLRGSGHRDAA